MLRLHRKCCHWPHLGGVRSKNGVIYIYQHYITKLANEGNERITSTARLESDINKIKTGDIVSSSLFSNFVLHCILM